jgi:hypothetical protein
MTPKYITLALCLGFAQVLSAGRLHDTERDVQSALRRHFVAHMRIAAADRLIEQPDEIAAYIGARFNTVVLYDTEDSSGFLKTEARIAYEVEFARAHGLHILLGKMTEASPAATDDAIRERLTLWAVSGHDVILGVFFLHDDACLIQTTVERQRHLYAIAHETVPDWYVFGMIGGFCYGPPEEEVARYFDPNAFDHLIILMYPLNGGGLVTSVDPDNEMRRYVMNYVQQMGERFISRLRPGQLAVLVIQSFAYYGEPATQMPRAVDIDIQATAGNAALREIAGQASNRSLAYFLWDGSRGGMFGLWQRPDWMAAAEGANRLSEDPAKAVDRQP